MHYQSYLFYYVVLTCLGFCLQTLRRNCATLHSSVNRAFRAQFKIDVRLNSLYCFENGVINNLLSDLVSKHQAP